MNFVSTVGLIEQFDLDSLLAVVLMVVGRQPGSVSGDNLGKKHPCLELNRWMFSVKFKEMFLLLVRIIGKCL